MDNMTGVSIDVSAKNPNENAIELEWFEESPEEEMSEGSPSVEQQSPEGLVPNTDASFDVEEDGQLLDEILLFLETHGIAVHEGDNGTVEDYLSPELLGAAEDTEPIALDDIPTDDTISLYFREMSSEPLLNRDEEIKLAQEIERGNEARQRLTSNSLSSEERSDLEHQAHAAEEARVRFIRANTQLVVSIAKKYRGCGVPFSDLIQEGNLGLMRAVEKFDYRHGNRFSTYATWWIRQFASRSLPTQGRTIRLPIQTSDAIRRLYRTANVMTRELGRRPTPEEIAQEMDLDAEKVRFLIQVSCHPVSLDGPMREEEDSVLGDFVADELVASPVEAQARKMLAEAVEQVLNTLPSREATILSLRFGLRGERVYTLKEVGEKLGLTRERIRQIQNKALDRLEQTSACYLLHEYL